MAKHYIRRKGIFSIEYVSVVVSFISNTYFSLLYTNWLVNTFIYVLYEKQYCKFWVTTVNKRIVIGTSEEKVLACRIRANKRCMDVITIPCVIVVNTTISKRSFSVVTHKQSWLDVENRGKWQNREFSKCEPWVSQTMDNTHPSKNSLYKKLYLATALPPPPSRKFHSLRNFESIHSRTSSKHQAGLLCWHLRIEFTISVNIPEVALTWLSHFNTSHIRNPWY